MENQPVSPTDIRSLQRCVNDLVSVLALPASWSGAEPLQIANTLCHALLGMLQLDLVCVTLHESMGQAPIQIVRMAPWRKPAPELEAVCAGLGRSLRDRPPPWPAVITKRAGAEEIAVVPLPLGLEGEFGIVAASSQRPEFPDQTETLLLSVAVNQALIGLQQAQLLSAQKRMAAELDARVAQRTQELAQANEELRMEIDTRGTVEEKLRHEESELRRSEARWRSVFENSAVGVALTDLAGSFLAANPVFQGMLGYSEEELKSLSFLDVTVERYFEPNRKLVGDLISGIRSEFQIEKQYRRKDGSPVWVRNNVSLVPGADGAPQFLMAIVEDISDRKRAEEALRASELSLRQTVDSIPGLVCTMNAAGELIHFNRQLLEYFGRPPEELKNWGTTDAVHPDDLLRVLPVFAKAMTTGQLYDVEHRCRRFDGVYRWFQVRALPVRETSGVITGWYVLLTDIHDRKQAEEAVRANERNLDSIINTMPTTAWSSRPDGYCEFLNQRWLDYSGMSAEQAQGLGWVAVIHPDDRERLMEYWQSSLATGAPVDTEARLRRFDGVYRWFLFRAHALRDETGNIVRWYGTNTDIDDRRRAEDQLRRSEAFLAEAQHLTRIGSFSWRVLTSHLTWSEQLYRIFEFEMGVPVTLDLIGSRVHPDDFALLTNMVESAQRGVSDFEYEHRLLMPDRSVRYLHLIAHAIRDHQGCLEYIGAVQDVTQRQLAEEALARARAELGHMTRVTSLGVLTASIAHEVNQPLSGIVTNAGTCLRMLNADPPNVEGARETARRTIRDGNRASDVITRLRTLFARKEIAAEALDLSEAAREVIALSLTEWQSNRVILRQELADDLPRVQADRVQIQQVILNLLKNASDAMTAIDDRPRELLVRTERDQDDCVRLSVRDAGVGFDPEHVDRLFDGFYTTKTDGMGIGLSVSRSIIEAHEGRLWATLNDGPGSTFAFSIPGSAGRFAAPPA